MSTYEEREALAAAARVACLEYLHANGYPGADLVGPDDHFGRPLVLAGGAKVDITGAWKKPYGRVEVSVGCFESAAPHIRAAGQQPSRMTSHRDGRDELRRLIPDYRRYESFAGVPHARLWKRTAAAIAATTAGLEEWRAAVPVQVSSALFEEREEDRFRRIASALGGWVRAGELRGINRATAFRIAEAMEIEQF